MKLNAWKPLTEFKSIAKAKMQQILKGGAMSISKLLERTLGKTV